MGDEHLRSAVDWLDSALARVEAALAGRRAHPQNAPDAETTAALAALERRHAALRKVMADSVSELDTLLAVAESAPAGQTGA